MDNKDEKKVNNKTNSKEEKIEAKAFNKVNGKTKKEDAFVDIDDKNKDVKKDKKEKSVSKDAVKGTVTINKKIEEKPKEKTKSSKKKGKWIALFIVLIFVVAIVVGIVFFMKTPYYALMKAFNTMKNGDIDSLSKYIEYDELIGVDGEKIDSGDEMSELEKNCFSEFTYKINTVKVEGDVATINVDTTNKNFRNAITKWTQQYFIKAYKGEEISREDGIKLLNECLNDSSIGTITTNKDITLNRVDGKWMIEVNEQLKDAIFPGQSDVVNSVDALTK